MRVGLGIGLAVVGASLGLAASIAGGRAGIGLAIGGGLSALTGAALVALNLPQPSAAEQSARLIA